MQVLAILLIHKGLLAASKTRFPVLGKKSVPPREQLQEMWAVPLTKETPAPLLASNPMVISSGSTLSFGFFVCSETHSWLTAELRVVWRRGPHIAADTDACLTI